MRAGAKITPYLFSLGYCERYEGQGDATARIEKQHGCYHVKGFSPSGNHYWFSGTNLKRMRALAEKIVKGEHEPGRSIDRLCKIQDGSRSLEITYGQVRYALKLYGEHVEMLKSHSCATDEQITTQKQIGEFIL